MLGGGLIFAADEAARTGEAFDKAYTAVRASGDLQLTLPPTPKPPPPPDWLLKLSKFLDPLVSAIGRGLSWLFNLIPGPRPFQILMWIALACLGLFLLRMALRRYDITRLRRGKPAVEKPEEDWPLDLEQGRQWLEEAEALAAHGDFGEAVHRLLLRSIEDLARRRPQLSLPSLTGRELAASTLVPTRARALFASIVAAVEPSLFGGRHVSEAEWIDARDAYREFALAGSWRS